MTIWIKVYMYTSLYMLFISIPFPPPQHCHFCQREAPPPRSSDRRREIGRREASLIDDFLSASYPAEGKESSARKSLLQRSHKCPSRAPPLPPMLHAERGNICAVPLTSKKPQSSLENAVCFFLRFRRRPNARELKIVLAIIS